MILYSLNFNYKYFELQLIQFLVTLRQPSANNTLCREVKNNVRYVLPIMHHKPSEKANSGETFTVSFCFFIYK